jgi:hypothetical protein
VVRQRLWKASTPTFVPGVSGLFHPLRDDWSFVAEKMRQKRGCLRIVGMIVNGHETRDGGGAVTTQSLELGEVELRRHVAGKDSNCL